jgi:hypothetical protein
MCTAAPSRWPRWPPRCWASRSTSAGATLAPYPVVPREEVGFRVQLTAANTVEQVDHLITVLSEIDDRFGFRRPNP